MTEHGGGAATEIQAGGRLRSATSEAQFIVVRPPTRPVVLRSGGAALVELDETPVAAAPKAGLDGPVLIGKRYVDETSGLEILCTKGGIGTLTCDERTMPVKDAKPLPSSD